MPKINDTVWVRQRTKPEKQTKTESNVRRLNAARAATTYNRQVICFTVKPVRSGMKLKRENDKQARTRTISLRVDD